MFTIKVGDDKNSKNLKQQFSYNKQCQHKVALLQANKTLYELTKALTRNKYNDTNNPHRRTHKKCKRHSREKKDLIWTKRQLGYCIVFMIGYWLRGTRAKVKSRVIRQFKKTSTKNAGNSKVSFFETHGNTLYRKNCSVPKTTIST